MSMHVPQIAIILRENQKMTLQSYIMSSEE